MKLPEKVKGQNKIRDLKIISLFAADSLTMEEIAERFHISATRVHQILYRNKDLLKYNREWEEAKQLNRIKRHIKKKPESVKDSYDWEVLLNDKISDKKAVSSGSGDTKIIIIRPEGQTTQTTISGISVIRPSVEMAVNGDKTPEVSG